MCPLNCTFPFSSWTAQCWIFDMYLSFLGSLYLFIIWFKLGSKVIFTQHASNTKWCVRQKFHQKLLPFKLKRRRQHEAIRIEQRPVLGSITKPWPWVQLKLGAVDFLVGTLCQFRENSTCPSSAPPSAMGENAPGGFSAKVLKWHILCSGHYCAGYNIRSRSGT